MDRHVVIYAREAYAKLLASALDRHVLVKSRADLITAIAKRRPHMIYVDLELYAQIEGATNGIPLIGVADGGLPAFLRALHEFPRLAHIVTTAVLSTPVAKQTLARLVERIEHGAEHQMLGSKGIGRVALLASSSRREARLERMRDFFTSQDIPTRTVAALSDIAEELMTNALYDAPTEAGYFKTPISRTAEVELPPEHACEISYAIDGGSGFVRIRDPFGAFTRARMFAVLDRCNSKAVELDESRGGAGLGLWRVFSTASTIAITVIPGRLTDIVAWIDPTKRRQLNAVSLMFPDDHALDAAFGRFAADHDHDLLDDSFTAVM
jgi:hypothetical protein